MIAISNTVIPGRGAAANPESITPALVDMDSGSSLHSGPE